MVDGEAGIGKTTVWLAALEQAQEAGFRVLSTRATSAESVLAYTSLAALLDELDDAAFAGLPQPQRLAIDRVLLRASADGPVTDQRAVAAGFRVRRRGLADESPVVVAIDDLQWIDPPSRMVISSATRRLAGRSVCSPPCATRRSTPTWRRGWSYGGRTVCDAFGCVR